jgi:biotin-(acetyl-CoA carboxylase) ligase
MFSLVLKVPGSMASCLVFLQYLFALSAVEALEDRVKLCLKWPNDIYADVGSNGPERYKKVGGVLVNTSYTRGQFNVVIGQSFRELLHALAEIFRRLRAEHRQREANTFAERARTSTRPASHTTRSGICSRCHHGPL